MNFSLGKRNESRAQWRADFRLVDRLPDTKVIRTKFLINFCFIAILICLLLFAGYREINKIGLRQSITSLQTEVQSRSSSNRHVTELSREFRMLANKMDDIRTLTQRPIRPTWLLVELARIRTPDVVYDTLSYEHFWNTELKGEAFKVRLTGKGRTTADIAELKNRLAILEVDESWELQVSEQGNPSKDATSGVFSFVIELHIFKRSNGSQ